MLFKPNLIQRLSGLGAKWKGLSMDQKGSIIAGSLAAGLVGYQFTPHAARRRAETQKAVEQFNRTGKWPKYM